MWDLTPEYGLEYDGELLVPRINFVAYRQIYVLENWLRRICLAAWMGRFGSDWRDHLDSKLLSVLSRRVAQNSQRLYLGAENDSELMWQATHGELIQLIGSDRVAQSIENLTGTSSEFLTRKLDELREIRNLLAHNRALARRTYAILVGLVASLEETVEHFRKHVLYGASNIAGDDSGDELGSYLAERLQGNDWSKFQAFVSRKGDFVEYVSLPVAPFDRCVDTRQLLAAFAKHAASIVASASIRLVTSTSS
jgi:hypothetical protein